jgi:hypothetical protein
VGAVAGAFAYTCDKGGIFADNYSSGSAYLTNLAAVYEEDALLAVEVCAAGVTCMLEHIQCTHNAACCMNV